MVIMTANAQWRNALQVRRRTLGRFATVLTGSLLQTVFLRRVHPSHGTLKRASGPRPAPLQVATLRVPLGLFQVKLKDNVLVLRATPMLSNPSFSKGTASKDNALQPLVLQAWVVLLSVPAMLASKY
jgi:hypothetical protein